MELVDKFGMDQAIVWSKRSPDPTTKVGAVILSPGGQRVWGCGCNRFAAGIVQDDRLLNRDLKNQLIVHAEITALLWAMAARREVGGGILYCTQLPCVRCAVVMIDAGIRRVVAPAPTGEFLQRWGDSVVLSRKLFVEADIELTELGGNNDEV